MEQHIVISATTLNKFGQLAELLEKASRLARELSQGKPLTVFSPTHTRPAHVPKDEEWYWAKEWQAGEREADEALARGEYVEFHNVADALTELHSHV